MNKNRLNNLWEFLKTKNTHTSKSLLKYAKTNNINEMTFRRDLHLLENKNLVKLNYGYLEVLSNELELTEKFQILKINNLHLKEKIAQKAISLLEEEEKIFVGPGSTCEQFTMKINKKVNLFVTNGINVLHWAQRNNFIKDCIIIGGSLINNSNAISGSTSILQIKNLWFSKIFITAEFIDDEKNVYLNNIHESNFIIELLKNANKKYLLVDSSKFGFKGLVKIGNLDLFNEVISF